MFDSALLLTCLASTWFMTGVIVFVHVVHYPLFDRVEPIAFARYHADHVRLTGYVVFLPMVVELATSCLIVVRRQSSISTTLAWVGFVAALLTWIVTMLFSVPAHTGLGRGFHAGLHRKLVSTNTIRLVAWIIHAGVVSRMVALSMR